MPKVWSPLATPATHPRDVSDRTRPAGIIVHTTGSGIVDTARRAAADPLEFAVSFYTSRDNAFAHYLVGHNGEIVQIAADTEKAWQAAWKSWEQQAYRDGSWITKWARDYADAVVPVPDSFYQSWQDRWNPLGFQSPAGLVDKVAGSKRSQPNSTFCGVELLDAKPFTPAQYNSLAKLVLDLSIRWAIPITYNGVQASPPYTATLPSPYLLGHEDVCPARRYKRVNRATGAGWDPGGHFSWPMLLQRVIYWASKDLREWYPDAQGP